MKLIPVFARPFADLLANQRGVTTMVVTLGLIMLMGITGLVVDMGNIKTVERALQASSDAAALAGASALVSTPAQAVSVATAYSSVVGGKNTVGDVTATMVSGYPALKCFTSTGVACSGAAGANGIVVRQTAAVNTWFAALLGVTSVQVTTTATAGIAGGFPQPLDVEIVLDTTASMNTVDPSCSIVGGTRLACALAGVRTLLNALAPSADRIGLMVFPGLQASQAQYDYDCSSTPAPKLAAYNASPVYQVVPLSSDYRTSNGAKTLNPSSNLAMASGGSAACPQGVSAVGGVGTFFADAITAAQTALANDGQPKTQKVLIVLSDGDANAKSGNISSTEVVDQCNEAIAAARAATGAGTWVYSIAYGASTAKTPTSCSTDTKAHTGYTIPISACQTMQQIASDPTKFYSDTVGGSSSCTSSAQSVSELVSLFQSIAYSLVPPRLLPDGTS
jgi:Flp pilus assembly protein TadG